MIKNKKDWIFFVFGVIGTALGIFTMIVAIHKEDWSMMVLIGMAIISLVTTLSTVLYYTIKDYLDTKHGRS